MIVAYGDRKSVGRNTKTHKSSVRVIVGKLLRKHKARAAPTLSPQKQNWNKSVWGYPKKVRWIA